MEKYQPLLYILPNEKYSLQQTVSSAINSAALTEEESDQTTSRDIILRLVIGSAWLGATLTFDLLGVIALLPFASRIVENVVESSDKYLATTGEKESLENKDSNLSNILEALNLEDWSAFIAQIPYSSIPEKLEFPPGHPLPSKLYRAHPLKTKSNKYIPIEAFDSLLYAEREAELIRLLVDLGATKIAIKEKLIGKTLAETKASAEIKGTGGLDTELKGDANKLNESTRTLSLEGKNWNLEMQSSFQEEKYSWLSYEPAWMAVVHARLYGKCLTASIELTNDDSYSLSGKIGLAEGLLQNLVGLDAGASFSRNKATTSLISVEFAPVENKENQ